MIPREVAGGHTETRPASAGTPMPFAARKLLAERSSRGVETTVRKTSKVKDPGGYRARAAALRRQGRA